VQISARRRTVSEYEVEGAAGAPPVVEGGVDDSRVTADSPVASALAGLDSLADRDLAEHPEVFERIHDDLHAALTAIDDA
jgi:hypothetical protein